MPALKSARTPSAAVATALTRALVRRGEVALRRAPIIHWSSPVPVFGELHRSVVATLGINPSSREFMAASGHELSGSARRLHTLSSLGLRRWDEADARHISLMVHASTAYFSNNPYDMWFGRLDTVLSAIERSFYTRPVACHLDLVPFATEERWASLSVVQRQGLLSLTSDVFANLLRESSIRVLLLNGRTVVSSLEQLARMRFATRTISSWALPRRTSPSVAGIAFQGVITEVCGIGLDREVLVLGFNHNLQSSYGVTNRVIRNMSNWFSRNVPEKFLNEAA